MSFQVALAHAAGAAVRRVAAAEIRLEQREMFGVVGVDVRRNLTRFFRRQVAQALLAHRGDHLARRVHANHPQAVVAREQEDVAVVAEMESPVQVPRGLVDETPLRSSAPARRARRATSDRARAARCTDTSRGRRSRAVRRDAALRSPDAERDDSRGWCALRRSAGCACHAGAAQHRPARSRWRQPLLLRVSIRRSTPSVTMRSLRAGSPSARSTISVPAPARAFGLESAALSRDERDERDAATARRRTITPWPRALSRPRAPRPRAP